VLIITDDPKSGVPITTVPTAVNGKDSRLAYKRTNFHYSSNENQRRDSDEFEYIVNDGNDDSQVGKETLVSNTRTLVSSDFRFTDGGWSTVGNTKSIVKYESSRSGDMSHYIYAVDDLIDVDSNKNDRKL
jgi:hypothetical protein